MAKVFLLLFGIVAFQRCSKAAPNELSENTSPVLKPNGEEEVRLDSAPNIEKKPPIDTDASQSQRQKRYYDLYDSPYDLPPTFSYPSQPHYSKRDGAHNTAVYGEDPLNIIFRRLHAIVRDVRYQSAPRPVHNPVPAYIPFFYIPPFECGCNNHNKGPTRPVNPATSKPPTTSDKPVSGVETTTNSSVTLDNRFGDKSQNWGIVTDKPTSDVGIEGDGDRPITFDVIPPEEPFDVPVPPVEHGTVQAGAEPAKIPNQITPPKASRIPDANYLPGAPPSPSLDLTPSNSKNYVPSLCDGAILACCSRPVVTDKCFESLGCEDPNIYGQPCDPNVQLNLINKFQYYQKRRAG